MLWSCKKLIIFNIIATLCLRTCMGFAELSVAEVMSAKALACGAMYLAVRRSVFVSLFRTIPYSYVAVKSAQMYIFMCLMSAGYFFKAGYLATFAICFYPLRCWRHNQKVNVMRVLLDSAMILSLLSMMNYPSSSILIACLFCLPLNIGATYAFYRMAMHRVNIVDDYRVSMALASIFASIAFIITFSDSIHIEKLLHWPHALLIVAFAMLDCAYAHLLYGSTASHTPTSLTERFLQENFYLVQALSLFSPSWSSIYSLQFKFSLLITMFILLANRKECAEYD